MSQNHLEQLSTQIASSYFFNELTFNKNVFHVTPGRAKELSDLVLWLDSHSIVIQAKKREATEDSSPEALDKWFDNKIKRKAVSQICNTLTYLNDHSGKQVRNVWDDEFTIGQLNAKNKIKVILYHVKGQLDFSLGRPRFYISQRAGFIHLIDYTSFGAIFKLLITPREIVEYFVFRQKYFERFPDRVNISEKWLAGRWLHSPNIPCCGCDDGSIDCEQIVDRFFNNISEFDVREIVSQIRTRVDDPSQRPPDYYRIILEIGWLSRDELKLFKERFFTCIQHLKSNKLINPLFFINVPRECGFIFVVVPPEQYHQNENYLDFMVLAAKQKHSLEKCTGVSFWRDGYDIMIKWMFHQTPLVFNPYIDEFLKKHRNFCNVSMKKVLRYDWDIGL